MFYGEKFSYNQISCEEYGMIMYNFTKGEDGNFSFTSPLKVSEYGVNNSFGRYYLGATQNDPMSITITFGVGCDRLDDRKFLTRDEINSISTWLTGESGYKKLTIDQPDMCEYYYNCYVEKLELLGDSDYPYAFTCTFKCDSSFAYLNNQTHSKDFLTSNAASISNYGELDVICQSSFFGYYKPIVEIEFQSTSRDVEIINETDDPERVFKFSNVPLSVNKITIDNNLCIISNDADLNIYPYFNFNFIRLKRGNNVLRIKGDCKIALSCDYPVNIGA